MVNYFPFSTRCVVCFRHMRTLRICVLVARIKTNVITTINTYFTLILFICALVIVCKKCLYCNFQRNIILVSNYILNEISSSTVRRLFRRGESAKYLIDDGVLSYIRTHKLYGSDSAQSASWVFTFILVILTLFLVVVVICFMIFLLNYCIFIFIYLQD